MGTIMSNGRTIYRYRNLILRTPFKKTITLNPVGNALYDVGSDYVQGQPTRDFYEHTSGVYPIASGHRMRKAYLLRQMPPGAA